MWFCSFRKRFCMIHVFKFTLTWGKQKQITSFDANMSDLFLQELWFEEQYFDCVNVKNNHPKYQWTKYMCILFNAMLSTQLILQSVQLWTSIYKRLTHYDLRSITQTYNKMARWHNKDTVQWSTQAYISPIHILSNYNTYRSGK